MSNTDNLPKRWLGRIQERWGRLDSSKIVCAAQISKAVQDAYNVTQFEAERQVRNWIRSMEAEMELRT